MLMIKTDVGVIEIRMILRVCVASRVMFIGSLISVVHVMVEKPVGNQPLFLAFDNLAVGGPETALSVAKSFKRLLDTPFSNVASIDCTK